MGDTPQYVNLPDSGDCKDKTLAPDTGSCLRADLPVPPKVEAGIGDTSSAIHNGQTNNYTEAITQRHQAKVQADAGDWYKASGLYQEAITAADKIDRQAVGKELAHVRAELKHKRNPETKQQLAAEEKQLYLRYQAPVSARTNYALASYRYGYVELGDKLWSDAVTLDVKHDLDHHPVFLRQIKEYRDVVVNREEAVGTSLSLLEKADKGFKTNGHMTHAVQQQYEQAIKAAETAESTLDVPLLQTELKNARTQLDARDNFVAKVTAFEKTLPADKRAQLADVDKDIAALQKQEEAVVKEGGQDLSKADQQRLSEFDQKLLNLSKQRMSVYKLPENLLAEKDRLNQEAESERSLQQIIDRDYTLLHLPAVARESYAGALETSGQHDAAAQQRKIIADTDRQFYDDVIRTAASVDGIAGAGAFSKALEMLSNNQGHLTPAIRSLFDQAKTAADTQLNTSKGQIEKDIQLDQAAIINLNRTSLVQYNQLFSEWKKNNPDGQTWDKISGQIASQRTDLDKLGFPAVQRESQEQNLNALLTKRDELLPDYLQHLKMTLAPELQKIAQLENHTRELQQKLNVETRMCAMTRLYEAIALRQSGDQAQIKEADALLKQVVDSVGANPQDISQAASDIMQTNGMNQAKPIFKIAIDMADMARSQQLQDALNQAETSSQYLVDPSQLVSQDIVTAHPELFSPDPRQQILADAPVQTRWLYAVSLFNSGEKKEGLQLLDDLRKQSSDIRTVATFEVASAPNTTTITGDLINSTAEKLMENEGHMQQAAGVVDMLTTVTAARFGAGPYAPIIGGAVGTAALTAMDYAFYGRTPTMAQVALYAGFGWGIGSSTSLAESVVTSQATRFLAPRVIAEVDPVIAKYAPESLPKLSDLTGSPRMEATSEVLKTMYTAEKKDISFWQYVSGRGSSTTYNEIASARTSFQRTTRLINALGLGAAIVTPPLIIRGANDTATWLSGLKQQTSSGRQVTP